MSYIVLTLGNGTSICVVTPNWMKCSTVIRFEGMDMLPLNLSQDLFENLQ